MVKLVQLIILLLLQLHLWLLPLTFVFLQELHFCLANLHLSLSGIEAFFWRVHFQYTDTFVVFVGIMWRVLQFLLATSLNLLPLYFLTPKNYLIEIYSTRFGPLVVYIDDVARIIM